MKGIFKPISDNADNGGLPAFNLLAEDGDHVMDVASVHGPLAVIRGGNKIKKGLAFSWP